LEGELFALLGVNGAGKSTTINMICTLLKKTSGDVWVCGNELGRNDDKIRKSIGVVFQGNMLDNMLTAEENLMSRASFYGISGADAKKRVKYIAEKLSMTSFLKSKYEKLSGGQRRKCDIARALISNPKILFLDEPTTGLDPQSRIDLWKTVDEIRTQDKMTVFLTTHYMEEAEKTDRAAIIDNGKILCLDTPQKLKSEYSNDTLRLVVKSGCDDALTSFLKNEKLEYIHTADTYSLTVNNSDRSIDLLSDLKQSIESFELVKGNMDSVFLNVVGRAFANE